MERINLDNFKNILYSPELDKTTLIRGPGTSGDFLVIIENIMWKGNLNFADEFFSTFTENLGVV